MDLSHRRTFGLGAVIATVAGLSIGFAATRDDTPEPADSPENPATIAHAPPTPRTLPTHVTPDVPPVAQQAQSCLLEGAALSAGLPRASGALVLSPDERSAAVADSDNDTVVLLAIESGTAHVTSRFSTGHGPAQVLLSPDGRAFVTERGSGSVSVFDPRTGRRLCTARVPADPFAMALSPDGATLFVTSGVSSKLTAIDTRTLRAKWSTDTPREPRAVALTRDGTRAVLSHIAGKPLSVFDVNGDGARALEVPDAPVPVERAGVVGESPIGLGPIGRPFGPGFRPGVHFGGTRMRDRGGNFVEPPQPPQPPRSVTDVRPVPSQAWSLATLVERNEMVVPFMVNRTGRELPPVMRLDRYGGGSVSEQRQNEKVTFAVGVFDPVALQWRSFEMPNGVQRFTRRRHAGPVDPPSVRIPTAAAIDPTDFSLVVASMGTGQVADVTLTGRTRTPSNGVASNLAGDIGIGARGRRAPPQTIGMVNVPSARAEHSETVPSPSGIAVTSDGTTLVYSQFEHALEVRKGDGRARIALAPDPLPPEVSRGRRLFYSANNAALSSGGLSCGGCHPDGRDDGLVWFLANGPRQTPTLAGRLVAPFNWTGSHRTIEGNVAQTITRLGGTGLSISDVDALAAYVQRGIEAPTAEPPSTPPDPTLVARGRDVFTGSGNCASCHDPARNFTDGQPHELGGLGSDERERMFDTPSLRYLRASGPFFHDGRYSTLRALLTDATARMGTIGSLASADVDALEAFLLTL